MSAARTGLRVSTRRLVHIYRSEGHEVAARTIAENEPVVSGR